MGFSVCKAARLVLRASWRHYLRCMDFASEVKDCASIGTPERKLIRVRAAQICLSPVRSCPRAKVQPKIEWASNSMVQKNQLIWSIITADLKNDFACQICKTLAKVRVSDLSGKYQTFWSEKPPQGCNRDAKWGGRGGVSRNNLQQSLCRVIAISCLYRKIYHSDGASEAAPRQISLNRTETKLNRTKAEYAVPTIVMEWLTFYLTILGTTGPGINRVEWVKVNCQLSI